MILLTEGLPCARHRATLRPQRGTSQATPALKLPPSRSLGCDTAQCHADIEEPSLEPPVLRNTTDS